MRPRARTRLRTTLLALCALLLAQWALATHGCPLYAAAGHAIAAATTAVPAPAAHSDRGCDEDEASTLCVKHCAGEEQATAQPAFAAAPPAATSWWASDLAPSAAPLRALRYDLAQPPAPPLNILYCVFLT